MSPNNSPSVPQPSLVAVESQFIAWRSTKKKKCDRIPEALWSAAVKLCEQYTINRVSKVLRLNYAELSKRVGNPVTIQEEVPAFQQSFIAIDVESSNTRECFFELEHQNGNKMRMHFSSESKVELQLILDSFWR